MRLARERQAEGKTYHAHPDGAQDAPEGSSRLWRQSGWPGCWTARLMASAGTSRFREPEHVISLGFGAMAIAVVMIDPLRQDDH